MEGKVLKGSTLGTHTRLVLCLYSLRVRSFAQSAVPGATFEKPRIKMETEPELDVSSMTLDQRLAKLSQTEKRINEIIKNTQIVLNELSKEKQITKVGVVSWYHKKTSIFQGPHIFPSPSQDVLDLFSFLNVYLYLPLILSLALLSQARCLDRFASLWWGESWLSHWLII